MTVDMTPPPLRSFFVIVDSPELPQRYEFDVEARVPVEAQVKAAERALAAAIDGGKQLPQSLRRLSQEDAVTGIAGYAEVKS